LATCLQAFRSLDVRVLACLPTPKNSRRRSAPKAKDPLPIAEHATFSERVDLLRNIEVLPAVARISARSGTASSPASTPAAPCAMSAPKCAT